jgi:hypothetical protein
LDFVETTLALAEVKQQGVIERPRPHAPLVRLSIVLSSPSTELTSPFDDPVKQ